MKNKNTLILLAILVVLVLVMVLSKTRENIEKKTNIFDFKPADVTRVEFIQPADTLIIALEGDKWEILTPMQLPVKEQQIQRFFDSFLTLTTSSIPISESPERQNFYQVDSTGVKITIFGKNQRNNKTVYYGRSNNNPSIAYIRADKSNKIFQIENVFSAINPTISTWRDDKILNITEDMIASLAFGGKVDAYELTQNGGLWTLNLNEFSAPLDYGQQDLTRLLNSIINLRTSTFFDHQFEDFMLKLVNPDLEILIQLFGADNIHLRIAKNDDNSYVLQRNDEETTLYRLTNAQYNQLVVEPDKFIPEGEMDFSIDN